jgi:hypothetical protein
LLTILRHHERREKPAMAAAEKAKREAEQAIDAFLKGCQAYRKLKRAVQAARNRINRLNDGDRKGYQKARSDCFNAVRLYGPVPKVVRLIERFLKRFP